MLLKVKLLAQFAPQAITPTKEVSTALQFQVVSKDKTINLEISKRLPCVPRACTVFSESKHAQSALTAMHAQPQQVSQLHGMEVAPLVLTAQVDLSQNAQLEHSERKKEQLYCQAAQNVTLDTVAP